MKTRILFLFTLLCAAIASLQIVHAATITVNNTADSGAGSLRGALASALDGDTIDATGISGTITLTTGQLVVGSSVAINGPGANNLAVDGNHASRVFRIGSGKTVTIERLTITNGSAGNNVGGGIFNDHAMLTVSNCTVSGNSSFIGGGIYSTGENSGGATLIISDSTFSGNSGFVGGGINSTGEHGSATVTISSSTVSGNSATLGGSGIRNTGQHLGAATLTVSNCTISDNSSGSGAPDDGGGIENNGQDQGFAILTIKNSTLSGNAGTNGGAIYNNGAANGSAAVTIGDTVLNAGASGANIFNDVSGGTITSLGYNLSSDDASAFLNQTGDQNSTDPMLGPIQDNGGPTFTHELLTGSPAINAGDPSFTPPPNYDQRGPGFDRVVNGRIDKGSFEVQTIICPQRQGYWKNNADAWPSNALPMTLGNQSYSKPQLLTILNTPVGTGKNADASLILAYQLIAAKLSIANGANGTPVSSTITDADSLLSGYGGTLPYHVKPSTPTGQAMVNDAAILESFNKGFLTPGCGG